MRVKGQSLGASSKHPDCCILQGYILQECKAARLQGYMDCKTARLQGYMDCKTTCCKHTPHSLMAHKGPADIYIYIYRSERFLNGVVLSLRAFGPGGG